MLKYLAAVFLLLAAPVVTPGMAQGVVAPPAPVESAPLAPVPTPAVPPVAPPAIDARPAEPPPAVAGQPDPNATLAGRPGDPVDVDEVVIASRPVAIIAGQTTWDQGFLQLRAIFDRLRAETAREGLKVAGRPLTLFVETDDIGFRYEAMLPIDRVPDGKLVIGDGIRFGVTPAGKSLRFTHKAPYDDIDSTYETITAYLEAKGVIVKDAFLEEYASEMIDTADPNLEINVYVQPK